MWDIYSNEADPSRQEASFKMLAGEGDYAEGIEGLLARTRVLQTLDVINKAIMKFEDRVLDMADVIERVA